MQSSEIVRSVRNWYYLGLFRNVVKESSSILSLEQKDVGLSAQVLYYRSLSGLGQDETVIKAISNTAPLELQAVKLLSSYQLSVSRQAQDDHQLLLDTLAEWNHNPTPTLVLCTALLFFMKRDYKNALKTLSPALYAAQSSQSLGAAAGAGSVMIGGMNVGMTLELYSFAVQLYLKMDRVDLAQKQVKAMQEIDDDDTLTTLATAWLYIGQGGDKVNEASFLLQELREKFEPSIPVLNCLAVCQIHSKNYTNAFQLLKQARDQAIQNKERVSAETLINSMICLQHLKKPPEIINRVLGELKQTWPNSWYLNRMAEADDIFNKTAANYKL